MNDCLFCKIIKGEIPSYTIYEDDIIKVFLDINPNSDGHVLVIPKKHFDNLFDMDDDMLSEMIKKIKNNIYPLLKDKLNIDGLTVCQNNFYGQDVKHFHIHLIPRYENNVFKAVFDKDMLSDIEDVYNKLKTE